MPGFNSTRISAAATTVAIAAKDRKTVPVFMWDSSGDGQVDALDDVVVIAGRVVNELEGLRRAVAVGGLCHQRQCPLLWRIDDVAPRPERKASVVGAERRRSEERR